MTRLHAKVLGRYVKPIDVIPRLEGVVVLAATDTGASDISKDKNDFDILALQD